MPESTSAASRYKSLAEERQSFLTTARNCAKLTIPYLVPPEGIPAGAVLPTPYQSVGSRGVNNLAAKLLLALLPPHTPFFRLAVDTLELKKISKDDKLKTQLEEALSEIEQATMQELEISAARVSAFSALLQLVVSGNALLEVPDHGNIKVYCLDHYVVQRDPEGNVTALILHESVSPAVLSPEVRKALAKDAKSSDRDSNVKMVDLYTVCERSATGKRWDVWQEVGSTGIPVPDTDGTYPIDRCPFIPLRFTKLDGEAYGRGYVEQYLGDLISLESLTQSLVEASQAFAKVIFLVRPGGSTNAQDLAESDNGDFVEGSKDDVSALQVDKYADLRVTAEQAANIQKRLEAAFLLISSVQRDAERVTAEEIRSLIQELETSLGGIYSVLAQEFQLPLATATMDRMHRDKRLPKLPAKIVAPTVSTGVEALGRGNDLQRLQAFTANVQQTFGPGVFQTYVDVSDYLTRLATALGINVKGLIRTAEQVNAMQQQQQQQSAMQELVGKLGPSAIKALEPAINGQNQTEQQ